MEKEEKLTPLEKAINELLIIDMPVEVYKKVLIIIVRLYERMKEE